MVAMNVQRNTVVSITYRFLSEKGTPIHKGRTFKVQLLMNGDYAPPFLEKKLMGKVAGERVTVPLTEELQYLFPPVDEEIEVSLEQVPEGIDPVPGMFISIMDQNRETRTIQVLEKLDSKLKARIISGNPYKTMLIEITIESVRWATPDEFIKGQPERHH